MRTMIHAAAAVGLLVAPTAAPAARLTPEAQFAKLVEGRVAGKPVPCLRTFGSTQSVKIPHTAIAYRDGSTWYVNRFRGDCSQLDDDTIIVTRTSMSQVCSGDIAELREQPTLFFAGSCVFDDFVPYTKVK